MRNGHQHQNNKRMRGRSGSSNNNNNNNNRGGGKSHNPLTRVYESNGPDVKIRGTASHVAEKYLQLARDANSSSDPVAAENYFQHAEHYFRLIATAQEQFRQSQPFPRSDGAASDVRDDNDDEGDDEGSMVATGNDQHNFGGREPQPYMPRDNQFYQPREPRDQPPQRDAQYDRPRDQQPDRRPQPNASNVNPGNVARSEDDAPGLPSFITGGGAPAPVNGAAAGQNGPDGERFPLHRRRRRHRGPRPEMAGSPQGEGDGPSE